MLLGCAHTRTFDPDADFPTYEGWEIAAFSGGFRETTLEEKASDKDRYIVGGSASQVRDSRYAVRLVSIELQLDSERVSNLNPEEEFHPPKKFRNYGAFGEINLVEISLAPMDSNRTQFRPTWIIPPTTRKIKIYVTADFLDTSQSTPIRKTFEIPLSKIDERRFAPLKWIGDRLGY